MLRWTPATALIVAAIYAGLLTATAIVGTIVYDLIALQKGWRTVSHETHLLGQTIPIIVVMVVASLCVALGILIGHLFFPQ
jgi:hypothetical protein